MNQVLLTCIDKFTQLKVALEAKQMSIRDYITTLPVGEGETLRAIRDFRNQYVHRSGSHSVPDGDTLCGWVAFLDQLLANVA